MLCDICHKREATVHITEIINNKMTELHLCEECAKKKSFQMEQHFGLADLLAGLSDFETPIEETKKSTLKCPNCGLTYEEFRKIGRLGCSKCYTTFESNLKPLLKRIHRATKHVGSAPVKETGKVKKTQAKVKSEESEINKLKEAMQIAIDKEEFEKAAEIRDKIKELKKNKSKEK